MLDAILMCVESFGKGTMAMGYGLWAIGYWLLVRALGE
jgi:hypothetical protein